MTEESTDLVPSAEDAPHAGGRPTLYREDYHPEEAFKLCLRGATDIELADRFGVCVATINNWKLAHPEFAERLNAGKVEADANVAHSLYERATGAEWVEEIPVKVKEEFFENGKKVRTEERVVIVQVTKRAAPDTTAGIFWSKNRSRRYWRDKQDVELTGKDGAPIATTVFTDEQVKDLIKQAEQDV